MAVIIWLVDGYNFHTFGYQSVQHHLKDECHCYDQFSELRSRPPRREGRRLPRVPEPDRLNLHPNSSCPANKAGMPV